MKIFKSAALAGMMLVAPLAVQADQQGKHRPEVGRWNRIYHEAYRDSSWRDRDHGDRSWRNRGDRWRDDRWGGRPGNFWRDNSNGRFESRIQDGIRSGRLSRDEVRELREKQRDVRNEARRYWSDGHLSRNEREELRDEYRDLKHDFEHEWNDGERRRNRGWWK